MDTTVKLATQNHSELFAIFAGIWIVLAIIGGVVFFLYKNAKVKRTLWPIFSIGTSLLFLYFISFVSHLEEYFNFIAIGIALITISNLISTGFCNSCGKTVYSGSVIKRPSKCTGCGESLTHKN